MNDKQLKELLKSLTVDEKIGQLNQFAGSFFDNGALVTGPVNYLNMTEDEASKLGSLLGVYDTKKIKQLQENHLKKSKVPLLFCVDVIHGMDSIYPVPLALGCSFSTDLNEEMSRIAAKECSDAGINLTFSPMVDLVRDARWGRVVESYGEDKILNSKMGAAAVKGYHADGLDKDGSIACCVKHFAAYGAPVGGRDYNDVFLSPQQIFNDYLPAYKACIEAGVDMVMTSFNTLNSEPVSQCSKYLKDILRDDWKFEGITITDYASLQASFYDGTVNDFEELTQKGVDSKINIDMCSGCYLRVLKQLYDKGKVSEETIDELVMPVLKLKNDLGLFENPYRFMKENGTSEADYKLHIEKVKNAVPKCSVLMKNEDKILPLKGDEKIAFIGPYTETNELRGPWSFPGKLPNENIREATERLYNGKNIKFAIGTSLVEKKNLGADDDLAEFENSPEKIVEAVNIAKESDIAVLFIGEPKYYSGEARSRADITVPKIQKELFDAVYAVNKNIVTVLFTGRPLDITEISEKSKAILNVWHPGNFGAEPIVDMLFAKRIPSGKLSMSFPYSVGQMPLHYDALPTAHRYLPAEQFTQNNYIYKSGYIDCPSDALYSFGFGLSYTEFEYSPTTLSKTEIDKGESVIVSAEVTNKGDIDAEEVVQLYMYDPIAKLSRPTKQLLDFKRVLIKVGETVKVEFTVTTDMLSFYDNELNLLTESGEYRLTVAPNSKIDLNDYDYNLNKRKFTDEFASLYIK